MLTLLSKEFAKQKEEILARLEVLRGLHEQTRRAVEESPLWEWNEVAGDYCRVGQTTLGAWLSGRSRFNWLEPRRVQVLSDTLDWIEGDLACQVLAPEILCCDRQLAYMSAYQQLFRCYFREMSMPIPQESLNDFWLHLRHTEAELQCEDAKIIFQYNRDCLWRYLNMLQQVNSELRDLRVLTLAHIRASGLRTDQERLIFQNQQKEIQTEYISRLLGWELPE